ncbi:LysR family transcriptional regulator [Kineosporia rhizophila]|uniref:LysR family transcriptional regulator n=1 Tax=Kineosporia TaxID=49184 RepID=UPI001E4D22C8|nr:LysR family transcriptional regulator [Kineosporia sp. NBRC 101677]MCE0536223.1 LysR family transcriptional regulator [Kineosporia rhizophila]GLY15190.1 LysR family transcriptional regulator [Kineosporia sp. NBRC 101677]
MDVVSGCQAFVSVSEHGGFTQAAAAVNLPQSVVSRRVAALERHLGEALFERTSRRVALTRFGSDLLPSARRLVRLADDLRHDAERARRRPFRLAVPGTCGTAALARLEAGARPEEVYLDLVTGGPEERAEMARSLAVRAALVAVPPDQGIWAVPLGLAGTGEPEGPVIHLESLRPGRSQAGERARVVRVQPEDDVPHVRDRLTRLRDAVGLRPAQVAVAPTLTTAVAEVLGSSDLLLCSPAQAIELGLAWRPVGEIRLARGYDVAAMAQADRERVHTRLEPLVAQCLGAQR